MTAEYLRALAGGLLIGLGAATLILFNDRIAGISGILGNVVRADVGPNAWRIAFLAGLVAPAAIVGLGSVRFEHGLPLLAVSGLLVDLALPQN